MKKIRLLVYLLVFAMGSVNGLQVIIDYSFRVPKEFGTATPESANCCPFGKLPENDTQGMVPPTIIGLGVQKGGTTTLYDHFRVHPQLIGARKELHYLDSGPHRSYTSYLRSWSRNREGPWKSVMVNGTSVNAVVPPKKGGLYEISPSYLFVPFAACKAKVIAPQGKFIIFLRDPTSRIYSGLSYTIQVMRHRSYRSWMSQSFWSLAQQGILEVEQAAKCNFQTGKGEFDYNDCLGCVLRVVKVQSQCHMRPFVTLTDDKGSYKCNFVGKEHVLRSMYGPQLAWWFTLHDPSQFKIINSNRFFERPLEVMQDIGKFLNLHPTYTEKMINKSKKKSNVGHYRKENQKMVDYTKSVLTEFYRRPNLELYRLLHETGHHDFEPFEKDLQSLTLLNCSNPKIVASGICGDPRFHKNHPEYHNNTESLPAKVKRAVYPVQPEDPKADAIAVMKETTGSSAIHSNEVHQDFKQPSSTKVDGNIAKRPEDFHGTEKPEDAEIMEAFGTIPEEADEIKAHEEGETDRPLDATKEKRGPNAEKDDADGQFELTKTSAKDKIDDSDLPQQNEVQATSIDGEESAQDAESYSGSSFRSDKRSEQSIAENGMITADHFVHFLYGMVFTALVFYCYRWSKRRQRRERYFHD